MEGLELGLYRLLTNFVLESTGRARFGAVVVENGRALLYERVGEAESSKPTECIFGELGPFQLDLLIKNSINIELSYFQVNEIRVLPKNLASAYTVVHGIKSEFRGFIDREAVTLVEKIGSLGSHSFHVNWSNDFDIEVDDFPRILDIDKNYYFDYYDGPIHGVLILKSGQCFLYDRYIDITGFYSSGKYIFGETNIKNVDAVRKPDWDIVGNGLPSITRKELRALFDTSEAEFIGVMDSFAAPAFLEIARNVPRILMDAGWGGTSRHPRRRGNV